MVAQNLWVQPYNVWFNLKSISLEEADRKHCLDVQEPETKLLITTVDPNTTG